MNILLVEDHGSLRHTLRLMLQQLGHTVTEATDYADAVSRLHAADMDAVLTDVHYPRFPGAPESECGLELVINCFDAGLPVAMMSGRDIDPDVRDLYPEVAAAPFLQKPFGLAELRTVMEELRRVGVVMQEQREEVGA